MNSREASPPAVCTRLRDVGGRLGQLERGRARTWISMRCFNCFPDVPRSSGAASFGCPMRARGSAACSRSLSTFESSRNLLEQLVGQALRFVDDDRDSVRPPIAEDHQLAAVRSRIRSDAGTGLGARPQRERLHQAVPADSRPTRGPGLQR